MPVFSPPPAGGGRGRDGAEKSFGSIAAFFAAGEGGGRNGNHSVSFPLFSHSGKWKKEIRPNLRLACGRSEQKENQEKSRCFYFLFAKMRAFPSPNARSLIAAKNTRESPRHFTAFYPEKGDDGSGIQSSSLRVVISFRAEYIREKI